MDFQKQLKEKKNNQNKTSNEHKKCQLTYDLLLLFFLCSKDCWISSSLLLKPLFIFIYFYSLSSTVNDLLFVIQMILTFVDDLTLTLTLTLIETYDNLKD